MIKIRPHHLLCMRAFIGKGYSESFTKNMNTIILSIKTEKKLQIVFHSDDICAECPHLEENMACRSENATMLLDNKVIGKFEIQERVYSTGEISKLMEKMTKEDFTHICSECSWFASGICEKNIFRPLLKQTDQGR